MFKMNKFMLISLSALSLLGIGAYGNSKVSHADTIYATNAYIYTNGSSNKPAKVIKSNNSSKPNVAYRSHREAKTTNYRKPRARRAIKRVPKYRKSRVRHVRHITQVRPSVARTHQSHQYKSKWHNGIPQKMSSVNGWISNIYPSHLGNHSIKYLRYTTPLYNSKSYSEGFNARPHYYAFKRENMGNQESVGNTIGVKNSQVKPYYRYLGHNYYSIISGNNFKDGLKIDLDMAKHPWKTTFYTPNYVTVKYINHNSIDIWNHHKFVGQFHRMSYRTATRLGY